MDIIIPSQLAEIEYNNSISATNYTKECILKQQRIFDHHCQCLNSTVKNKIKHTKSGKKQANTRNVERVNRRRREEENT